MGATYVTVTIRNPANGIELGKGSFLWTQVLLTAWFPDKL